MCDRTDYDETKQPPTCRGCRDCRFPGIVQGTKPEPIPPICDEAAKRTGPRHEQYGYDDSGNCHCAGCSWDDWQFFDFRMWMTWHKRECAMCAAHYKARPFGRATLHVFGEEDGGDVSFDDIREANMERAPTYRNKRGELMFESVADFDDTALSFWGNAIAGETGEMCNVIKKIERGDFGPDSTVEPEALDALGRELADIVTYCDIIAFRAGINLGHAYREKFNAVSERVGSEVTL